MQIDRVTLASRNLEAQRHFYGELLGLPTTLTADGSLLVQVGRSELLFRVDETVTPFYHVAFNIPTNQAEAAAAWASSRFPLLDKDGEIISYSSDWNAHGFYFYDADGNIMEMIARHTLPTENPNAFGPEQILSISEVGLPVPEVPGTVDRFEQALALPAYDCDRVQFNAMGDEHGLLIVVAAGRNWFPTKQAALPLPLRIELRAPIAAPIELSHPEYVIVARPL
jgi:catechol-2,3-dioxygenase